MITIYNCLCCLPSKQQQCFIFCLRNNPNLRNIHIISQDRNTNCHLCWLQINRVDETKFSVELFINFKDLSLLETEYILSKLEQEIIKRIYGSNKWEELVKNLDILYLSLETLTIRL